MNILVIANANSEWTYNFISLFRDSKINISLWSLYRKEKSLCERYEELGVPALDSHEFVYSYLEKKQHSLWAKIVFLITLILSVCRVLRICRWDVINVQYVDPHLLRVFGLFPSFSRKCVLSYWGSDLLREEERVLQNVKGIVKKARGCTFDNADLKELHERLYPEYNRRSVVMLPLPILDEIDRLFEIKKSDKIIVDEQVIDREKISICIGYNGSRQQQHSKVLDQLLKMDESIKKRIVLLFPFTYSVDVNDVYIYDLKKQIKSSTIESHIFERRLSDQDIAKLRLSTDIYINAQTTDAFSGSICEVLYAGGRLVNPQWLHYEELDIFHLDYTEYTDFEDLTMTVEAVVTNFSRSDYSTQNQSVIRQLRSVEYCKMNWSDYFSYQVNN